MDKLILLITGLLSTLLITLPLTTKAASDSAIVTISGTVKNDTCTLQDDKPSATLPPVSVRDFKARMGVEVSSVIIPVTFKDCGPGATGLNVKVQGTSDSGSDGYAFANTATGTTAADGVGVYFYNPDESKFKPDGSVTAVWKWSKGMTINYSARYVSTKATVTAGLVNTVVTIIFTYE